jgi:ATP-dependent helicase HrpB
MMTVLPIHSILPTLQQALTQRTQAILTAPPGSGKTTEVPLAVLGEGWLQGQRIMMLEPRRLAARAAACYMARKLGEQVGQTVGYRIRLESRVSASTQIEVVTEGVLTRMLQSDPSLAGYGLVIFDEFHERNLHADLGLALCLDIQGVLREDLRLLVMSATLDVQTVSNLLDQASVITGEGKRFPVRTVYLESKSHRRMEDDVVHRITKVFSQEHGNILVFLPGVKEIQQVEQRLQGHLFGESVIISPLFGDLPQRAQDEALAFPSKGQRKIVLATPIAETSLTIEGIRVVIDAGWVRVPRFDPRSGMSRLETVRVSQDSADQRRGRAGRVEPGVCFRLWTEQAHRGLREKTSPEMLEADMASLALELAVWGVTDPAQLSWLDPPPPGAFGQSQDLLKQLEALDEEGKATDHGRSMAGLGLHPRLAHMVLKGREHGVATLACDLAALLSERDFLKFRGKERHADIRLRLDLFTGRQVLEEDVVVDHGTLQRIRKNSQNIESSIMVKPSPKKRIHQSSPSRDMVGVLLALAYPDRIAQRQKGDQGRFRLANGRGAHFAEPELLAQEDYLVVPQLDGRQQWARIFLAAPVSLEDLEEYCPDQIRSEACVSWDDPTGQVVARQQQCLGELILEEHPLPHPGSSLVVDTFLQGIRRRGLKCLPWSKALRHWQTRVGFVRSIEGAESSWPDVSNEGLINSLEQWLVPFIQGKTRLSQIYEKDLRMALFALFTWDQQQKLDQMAPTHFTVPTGSRIVLDYESGNVPILKVRLQEVFGMKETPIIGKGKVPLVIHLLSPARRPVQVTQDLGSFWKTSYQDVKKELKGRYPKHYWPDDPLQAEPTRRVRTK